MDISDHEFGLMRDLIYKRFGINLTERKKSLLVGRLRKVLRKSPFSSFSDYYNHLLEDTTEQALGNLIDHVSTNHTYFYREKAHFDYFSEVALPLLSEHLKKERSHDLRIWCAGCSSGEEAYMLLMLLHEFFKGDYNLWEAGILATDISRQALDKAERGVYLDTQIELLPETLKKKYLRRHTEDSWIVCDRLRQDATFRRFNLMNDNFPFKQPFHLIFCRNVMIYFDQQTRDRLVTSFHKVLVPQGYLILGHSESINRGLSLYSTAGPAIYQKI